VFLTIIILGVSVLLYLCKIQPGVIEIQSINQLINTRLINKKKHEHIYMNIYMNIHVYKKLGIGTVTVTVQYTENKKTH